MSRIAKALNGGKDSRTAAAPRESVWERWFHFNARKKARELAPIVIADASDNNRRQARKKLLELHAGIAGAHMLAAVNAHEQESPEAIEVLAKTVSTKKLFRHACHKDSVAGAAYKALVLQGEEAVPVLVKNLGSWFERKREMTEKTLGEIASKDARVLAPFIGHKRENIRLKIVEILSKTRGRASEELLESVIKKDSEALVRVEAVRAIAEVSGRRAERMLLTSSDFDSDLNVRAIALEMLGKHCPESRKFMHILAKTIKSYELTLRLAAYRTCGELATDSAARMLIRNVSGESSVEEQNTVCNALAKCAAKAKPPAAKSARNLVKNFVSSRKTRFEALNALAAYMDKDCDAYTDVFGAYVQDKRLCIAAARGLTAIGSARAVELLITALSVKSIRNNENAVKQVGKAIGEAGSVETLRRLFSLRALDDRHSAPSIIYAMAFVLRKGEVSSALSEEEKGQILRKLYDTFVKFPEIRARAYYAIGGLRSAEARVYLLREYEESIRQNRPSTAAMRALAFFEDDVVFDRITSAFSDGNQNVRKEVVVFLMKLRRKELRLKALPFLLAANVQLLERKALVAWMDEFKEEIDNNDVLALCREHFNPVLPEERVDAAVEAFRPLGLRATHAIAQMMETEDVALRALALLREFKSPETVEPLCKFFDRLAAGSQVPALCTVVETLAEQQDERAMGPCIRCIQHSDDELARAGQTAILKLPAERASAHLMASVRTSPAAWASRLGIAFETLGKLGTDEALDFLVEYYGNASNPADSRELAIKSVGLSKSGDAKEVLTKLLRSGGAHQVTCARVLATEFIEDKETLKLLAGLRTDANPELRAVSVVALAKKDDVNGLLKLAEDSERVVQAATFKALAPRKEPRALRLFVRFIADPDAEIAATASGALESFGDKAKGHLLELARDDDAHVRKAALSHPMLLQDAGNQPLYAPLVYEEGTALRVLGARWMKDHGDVTCIAPLVDALSSPGRLQPEVRTALEQALASVKTRLQK